MFGTMGSVPYINTYEGALARFNTTTPIRGSNPVRRPLGERKHQHLSIDKTGDNSIQLILYDTPVITFKPDNTVVIAPKQWTSAFTCSFISGILRHVHGRHQRGKLVVDVHGQEYVIEKEAELVLKRVETGLGQQKWEVQQAEGAWTFKINTQRANNVRSQFKPFLQFFKGFTALNSEHVADADPDEPFETQKVVRVSTQMLKDVLGTATYTSRNPIWSGGRTGTMQWQEVQEEGLDTTKWQRLAGKPIWGTGDNNPGQRKNIDDWKEQREYLANLMRSEDTADHLKATLILFAIECGLTHNRTQVSKYETITLSQSKAARLATDRINWMYAEEVLEYVQVPVGRVPTADYGQWLFQADREKLVSGRG